MLRRMAVWCALASFACAAEAPQEREPAQDETAPVEPALLGSAAIVEPVDGAVVGSEVRVMLVAAGVQVEPAVGTRVAGRGHHHIFVDRDVTPAGEPIPKDVAGIIHLGTGSSEFTVKNLAPGEHRLIAVLAYGDHVPMERVAADTVRITVRARD